MDPLSIIGGVGAAAGIIATITKCVKGLSDIQAKYAGAELSVRQIIRQLTVIKASLSQIQVWTEADLHGYPREGELVEAFNTSLDGCQEAMQALADEVAKLVQDALAGDSRTMRARFVWNEESMKDHQGRLHSQIQALQLLLSAVQCQTASEQKALLREPKNQRIVEKVRDDTSTLRARSIRNARSPSVFSHGNSTIGSTVFDMDPDLVNTAVYRRTMMAHQRAKSADERNRRTLGDHSPNSTNGTNGTPRLATPDADSGFAEWSEYSDHLSPIDARFVRARGASNGFERPRPYERSIASEADVVPRQPLRRPQVQITSASDPFLPGLNLQTKNKLSKKRSFLPSLFTGSSSTLASTLSPMSAGHRRGRRHSDTDIHRSIDLDSTDGQSAPPLVQAAQSGSGIEIEELLDQRVDIESKHERTRRTALAVASHCGNDDVVAILLRHGANPKTVDAYGMTPLHLAAIRGHYRVVDFLLKEGVDVDAPGPELKTALRLAADTGHVEVVELLLRHRAKVNSRDAKNITALHSAARQGDEDIVQLLLHYKADIEAKDGSFQAAIHHASEQGHDRIVEVLLTKKANIEAVGKESMSPLTAASAAGSADVVRLLLQKKASVKHKGDGAMTCLHWASYNGHSDVVDLLLERKASIDPKTHDGRTPLHLAVMAAKFATAELLLRKNANVDAACENGLRPLHYAAQTANSDLIQLLLGHGAAIEAETRVGKRPIHYAASQGNSAVLDLLLKRGAAIDVRDGGGDRPLCIACVEGHLQAVRLLLDRGAEQRTRYSRGPSHEDSPMCIATKYGHLAIVEEFVQRGASVRQRDESNWQPLRYAAFHAHPELVEYLLTCGASIAALDMPGSFGFNMTASRIGFAKDPAIDEYRRQAVMMLLSDAEVREQEAQSSNIRRGLTVRSPQQAMPAEKGNDTDYRTVYQPTPDRQELPTFQRSPRQEPPRYNPPPPETLPTDGLRRVTLEDPPSSTTPPREATPPPAVSQASRFTLDPASSNQPRWQPVAPPPVPRVPTIVRQGSNARQVSPMPPDAQRTFSPMDPRIVSPLPSQAFNPGLNRSISERLPTVPQSPARPPPPPPGPQLSRADSPDDPYRAEEDSQIAEDDSSSQIQKMPTLSTNNPYAKFLNGDSLRSANHKATPPRTASGGSTQTSTSQTLGIGRSPSAPTRSAPLPPSISPNLPPIPDPNDAIVVCDACARAGSNTTDLTCAACRQALYMYHHVMSGESVTSPVEFHSSGPSEEPQIYELA